MSAIKMSNRQQEDSSLYERVLDSIDSSVSNIEVLIWRLTNFDPPVFRNLYTVPVAKLDRSISPVEEKVVLPSIRVIIDRDRNIVFIGVDLTEKSSTQYIVESAKDGQRVLLTDVREYVLEPIQFDTSVFLLLNRGTELVRRVLLEGLGLQTEEFDDYLSKAAALAPNFVMQLEAIGESVMAYRLGYARAFHVDYAVPEHGIDIRIHYYDVNGDLWTYIGIDDTVVYSPKKIDRVIPHDKRKKVAEALQRLDGHLKELTKTLPIAYLVTKMIRNIQPV